MVSAHCDCIEYLAWTAHGYALTRSFGAAYTISNNNDSTGGAGVLRAGGRPMPTLPDLASDLPSCRENRDFGVAGAPGCLLPRDAIERA